MRGANSYAPAMRTPGAAHRDPRPSRPHLGGGLGTAHAQEGAAVSIVDFAFDPAAVEVPVGATVTWTNTGAAPHTATASDGTFDSGELAPGASFSHTFTAAGTFLTSARSIPR